MMDFRLLVIASTLSCVFAQAPGDSASLCVDKFYNNGTALVPNPFFGLHPVYRSNVRPLMDSRDYVNLLDTPNPVWQQVDNDTSNAADTITNVSSGGCKSVKSLLRAPALCTRRGWLRH